MAEDVRATRRYDSPRRRAQAAATRADILGAAQRLFERQGYAATTMDAIAVEAGVALKTVYVAFETKSGLLRALWNHLLRAGRDETPVAEQEWYREMLEEPDAERQLRLLARNARVVKLRIGGVLEVIRSAAPGRRRDRRALEPHRTGLPGQPTRSRPEPRRQARAAARDRRRRRHRHPLDAQSLQRMAPARGQARLDPRPVRALDRRRRLLAAPRRLTARSNDRPATGKAYTR